MRLKPVTRRLIRIGIVLLVIGGLAEFVGMFLLLRPALSDAREIRFRVLPPLEWGFGRDKRTLVPLKNNPTAALNTATNTAGSSGGAIPMSAASVAGTVGFMPPARRRSLFMYNPRARTSFYRLRLETPPKKPNTKSKPIQAPLSPAVLAMVVTKGQYSTGGAGGLNRMASLPYPEERQIVLYLPANSALNPYALQPGLHTPPSNASPPPSPTPAHTSYWPFVFPRLPKVPGPYPSPSPSPSVKPSPSPPVRKYTRTVRNGKGKTSTYTYYVSTGPVIPANALHVPGYQATPWHHGRILPEPLLELAQVEGERLRAGIFEITYLPRIKMERIH
jgi:hypothetical protein